MTDKRTRGRPRRADADAEILAAAMALLRERGYRDFNVDVIVERTGIAKTTIYRRWPSKPALVAAAIGTMPDVAPDAASILQDVEAVLALLAPLEGDVVEVLKSAMAPRRALLVEAMRDAEGADALLGKLVLRALLATG